MAKQNYFVIAHRGASGYLPEHTFEAKTLALMMGAEYLEQDVVLTSDNVPIILHDIYLNNLTDVHKRFPKRCRDDGKYYVMDFTLEEVRSLQFSETFEIEADGRLVQTYPNRFPMWKANFKLHTLAEEIEFIEGLNKTLGSNAGLYVETKAPWLYKEHGYDISRVVLETLKEYGCTGKNEKKVFFQTFDYADLKRVKTELMVELDIDIRLVLLLAYNEENETFERVGDKLMPLNFDYLRSKSGLKEVADYAYAIGPHYEMIIDKENSKMGDIRLTSLAADALSLNLELHPYTLRRDRLPSYAANMEELLDMLYNKAGCEALFTDFPDIARNFLNRRSDGR